MLLPVGGLEDFTGAAARVRQRVVRENMPQETFRDAGIVTSAADLDVLAPSLGDYSTKPVRIVKN